MIENRNEFKVFQTISAAWKRVSSAKKVFFAGFMLVLLLSLGMEIAKNMAGTFTGVTAYSLWFGYGILYIIQVILTMSCIYLGLKRAFDKPIEYNDLRYAFNLRLLLKLILLTILQLIVLSPAILMSVLPVLLLKYYQVELTQLGTILLGLLYVLLTGVMIFLSLRMFIAKEIVIAENEKPWNALKRSFKATRSHIWRLLGFNTVNIFIILASIIPLGIGLIWTLPYIYISMGVIYKTLTAAEQVNIG